MNWAHLHLIVNHLPVLGVPFGGALLAWGWLAKSRDITRAALVVLVLAGSSAGAAYLSGQEAQHLLENLPDVSPALVSAHEDAALFALIGAGLSGLLACLALFLSRKGNNAPRWSLVGVFALVAVSSIILARTATLGGRIRHPEIRPGYTAPSGEDATGRQGVQASAADKAAPSK